MIFGLLAATLPFGFVSADYGVVPSGNNLPTGTLSGGNQYTGSLNTATTYPSGNTLPTANLTSANQNQNQYDYGTVYSGANLPTDNLSVDYQNDGNNNGNNNNNSNDGIEVDVSIDDIDDITDESATITVEYDIEGINLSSSDEARIYVRYGTSSSNLNKTSDSEYSDDESDSLEIDLDDLNDDTKYYVQAVVRVDGEYYYSSKKNFTTDENETTVTTSSNNNSNTAATYSQSTSYSYPTTTTTSTVKTSSGVVVSNTAHSDIATLVIKNNVTAIGRGDTVSYLVEYKNISKSTISRARLVVSLPSEMRVTASMMGMQAGNTFIMDIGSLAPGESDSIMFVGKMLRSPLAGFVTAQATLTGEVNGNTITIDSADADPFGNAGTALTGSAVNSGVGASVIVIIMILAIAGLVIAIIHYLTKDQPKPSHKNTYGAY